MDSGNFVYLFFRSGFLYGVGEEGREREGGGGKSTIMISSNFLENTRVKVSI